MNAGKELFSTKLRELEQEHERIRSRRRLCQQEDRRQVRQELDCLTRDGLLLDVATVMTTARVRVKELVGKDLPGGRSTFTVRFEVRNVAELDAIRTKLMSIRDVVGSRRGQN